MSRITVLGGTGYTGGAIVRAAAARGHQVTSYSRHVPAEPHAGVTYRTGSIDEEDVLRQAVGDSDVVVVAVPPRGEMLGRVRPAIQQVARYAGESGTRVGVIGGAGTLHVSENGPRVIDTAGFPEEVKPESNEMGAVLDDLRATDDGLDWFYLSPAGGYGAWAPGESTGTYRVGGEVLLTDEEGESFISGADLADAVVNEIEEPRHSRQRFTVAY